MDERQTELTQAAERLRRDDYPWRMAEIREDELEDLMKVRQAYLSFDLWLERYAEQLCCEKGMSAVAVGIEDLQEQLQRAKRTIAKLHGKISELENGEDTECF